MSLKLLYIFHRIYYSLVNINSLTSFVEYINLFSSDVLCLSFKLYDYRHIVYILNKFNPEKRKRKLPLVNEMTKYWKTFT